MRLSKPMKLRDYQAWIRQYGWRLEKASNDWKLLDNEGKIKVLCIIVTHPGKEVVPLSLKKTHIALHLADLQ